MSETRVEIVTDDPTLENLQLQILELKIDIINFEEGF